MTTRFIKGRNSYASILATILLFILVGRVLFIDLTENFTVSIDDILALILLIFSMRLLVTQSAKGQYIVLGVLIISLINILQFNIVIGEERHTTTHTALSIGALSFNAFTFLLLIFYCVINWKGVKTAIKVLLRGSESEQKEKREKLLVFYYDKFKNCTEDELLVAFGMFKNYPLEAQEALNKIKSERILL
jgi:hypothetical protein